MGVRSAVGEERNKGQSSLEEMRNEKDINDTRQEKRRWYNLKVMDTRIILAALGGVVIAFGFLLDLSPLLKLILVILGIFLIYQGRYY